MRPRLHDDVALESVVVARAPRLPALRPGPVPLDRHLERREPHPPPAAGRSGSSARGGARRPAGGASDPEEPRDEAVHRSLRVLVREAAVALQGGEGYHFTSADDYYESAGSSHTPMVSSPFKYMHSTSWYSMGRELMVRPASLVVSVTAVVRRETQNGPAVGRHQTLVI